MVYKIDVTIHLVPPLKIYKIKIQTFLLFKNVFIQTGKGKLYFIIVLNEMDVLVYYQKTNNDTDRIFIYNLTSSIFGILSRKL